MEDTFQTVESWQQLCMVAPCGLILVDSQGIIRFMNPAAATLLGLDSSTVLGHVLLDALTGWKDTIFASTLASLFASSSEAIDFTVFGVDQQPLRLSVACVPNGTTKPRGLLLTITEQGDTDSLKRRLHRAEYQASIGKLARGIAHELNSPLDGVLRYTHLALEQLTEDSSIREYLVHVKQGLDRMVRAVRTFLEFSRQVTTPAHRVADLNRLIEDALILLQPRARFQHVQIVKHFDPSLPAVLDSGIQHVVLNLVKNAFDAMPRGGLLTITTRLNGDSIYVEVEDTGMGIPESIHPRIFEPFFSTKPIHQGSGLGLVIAKEVVERSGGTIEFTSHAGVGSRFCVRLPIAQQQPGENGA